ncbi:MAG: uroporphyrinogen decarboxylase family protein [Chloroflexota bacterium]
MTGISPKTFLPVEIVFHPSWWNRHYGLTFDEAFFFDPTKRVESERLMRAALYQRFGDLGLGEANAIPRPVIGPVHLAAGFLPSAVLGCQIRYFEDASPEVIPADLSDEQVAALDVPDLGTNPAFGKLIALMDGLQAQYGTLEGDVNWEGVQNVALNLRGAQLFVDYYENPALARRLLDVVARTLTAIAAYVRCRTGSNSMAVNRIVGAVDPHISLHSNCTVAMISARTYRQYLLNYDRQMAKELWPYGIHHCGADMHKVCHEYAMVDGAEFFDVGWGSDVATCRAALPNAIFSLRLSPVRVATLTPTEVMADVENLLRTAGPLERAALCCINMDETTPDANVRAIFEVVERYRRCGAWKTA